VFSETFDKLIFVRSNFSILGLSNFYIKILSIYKKDATSETF
jgi:hypothetical protein